MLDPPVKNHSMTLTSNGGVASFSPKVNSVNSPSYSEITEVRPTEEQAIVLDISSGFANRKYTDALLEFIKPTEIKYMSRISGARFCLFLSEAALVKKLVDEVKILSVEGHPVKISPLVQKSKKVIISNASPVLSNSAIKRYLLSELNVRVTSSVSELKANSGGDERLASVGSFRRQVYVHPDDAHKLPVYHQFESNGKKYNVFFTTDKPVCFRCKSADHFAKNCSANLPNIIDDMLVEEDEEGEGLAQATNDKHTQPADKTVPQAHSIERASVAESAETDKLPSALSSPQAHSPTETSSEHISSSLLPIFASPVPLSKHSANPADKTKRTSSVLSDSSNNTEVFEGDGNAPINMNNSNRKTKVKTVAQTIKKPKIQENGPKKSEVNSGHLISELNTHLAPAKEFIETNFDKYLMDYDNVIQLIKKTAGKKAEIKRSMTAAFVTDSVLVIELLDGIYKLISNPFMKNKITRLRKALQSPDSVESGSDCSLSSIK